MTHPNGARVRLVPRPGHWAPVARCLVVLPILLELRQTLLLQAALGLQREQRGRAGEVGAIEIWLVLVGFWLASGWLLVGFQLFLVGFWLVSLCLFRSLLSCWLRLVFGVVGFLASAVVFLGLKRHYRTSQAPLSKNAAIPGRPASSFLCFR